VHARGQTLTGYGLLSSRQSGTRNINVRFDSKANGTGVLRQFASKATRLSSRVAFWRLGVYWKPVWHILEGHFVLILANAAHVKTVPGRKSDVNDATWLADLLISRKRSPPASRMLELPAAATDEEGTALKVMLEADHPSIHFRREHVLESVRKHQAGLQSFRSMRRIEASRRNASALRLRFSQSLASLRQRLSQAKVRSTTQRRGSTTNPFVRSERLTISVSS